MGQTNDKLATDALPTLDELKGIINQSSTEKISLPVCFENTGYIERDKNARLLRQTLTEWLTNDKQWCYTLTSSNYRDTILSYYPPGELKF